MPIPNAGTCSHHCAALAAHAENRDCPRCPGNSLSPGVDGRNLSNSTARKLTEPAVRAKLIERHASHNVRGRSGLPLPESETAAQNDMLRGVLVGVRSEPGSAPGRSARRWGIV